jgi:hypothetical protein
MFVRSGETVPIELIYSSVAGSYSLYADSGEVVGIDHRHWRWTAPSVPGRYRLVLTDVNLSDPVVIEAVVEEGRAARSAHGAPPLMP